MRYRTLCHNSDFSRVYTRGRSYVSPQLVLYVLKNKGRHTRIGLTATKKIGHAVDRNRARRVMRAAICEHLDADIGNFDLVFVARGRTPHIKSTVLSATVAKLFAAAGLPDKAAGAPARADAAPAAPKPAAGSIPAPAEKMPHAPV